LVETEINIDFDVDKVRKDFPIVSSEVHGKQLVYFDNAATTHKPSIVVDSLEKYYFEQNSNIHRAVHRLSIVGTELYENARDIAASFINAYSRKELIFTRGTTESINLVAYSWGNNFLSPGDEILITEMEHHANIVPWQLLCERIGCKLKVARITDKGDIDLESFDSLLSEKTKLVAVVHVSNTLGTINDVKRVCKRAKEFGAKVLIDGAQAVQHIPVDVRDIGCDFYAFSGHKLYGPTGIGFLWGKESILEDIPPFISGGDMIKKVSFNGTTFNDLPYKFEAGTPSIAPAIGMGAAFRYVNDLGIMSIQKYENSLHSYLKTRLAEIEGIRLIGESDTQTSVCSFVFDNIHHNDIGTMLDLKGIAVRTGHHCTQPLMERMGINGTTRVSLSFYNTRQEIDYFIDSLNKVLRVLN